jgi:hypothetical protein
MFLLVSEMTLRDVRQEAIDIYNDIDKKSQRESYLPHIPQLGI